MGEGVWKGIIKRIAMTAAGEHEQERGREDGMMAPENESTEGRSEKELDEKICLDAVFRAFGIGAEPRW